ncbi:MAG: hypothetical protein ACI906_000681 [Candidatus Latescibacterota bacterium]|jgi:hypothetical protein
MDLRKYFCIFLLIVTPISAQEIRVASFHASNLSLDSDLAGIADRLQAYDFIAIQDLRDLAAVDELLATLFRRSDFFKILPSQPSGDDGVRYAFAWRDRSVQIVSPGSFLGSNEERRPVYALFRAENFDFAAVNFQSATTATAASEDNLLDAAYAQLNQQLPDERDIIFFGSFTHAAPHLSGVEPIFPRDSPTSIKGDSTHANIYISNLHTREYSGRSGIDFFDEAAFANDLEAASRVSFMRPVWADFTTSNPDDDGPGISAPSPVRAAHWAHIKAARSAP